MLIAYKAFEMPVIYLEPFIDAPIEKCFDLARSIDLHMESTKHTGETAIAGKTSGIIELNETVTWRAKHFRLVNASAFCMPFDHFIPLNQ